MPTMTLDQIASYNALEADGFLDAAGCNDMMPCGHPACDSTQTDWNEWTCVCGAVEIV